MSDRFKPSREQRELLLALIDESKKEESAAKFAQRFLPFGSSYWSQIIACLNDGPESVDSYFDKVSDAKAAEIWQQLEDALDDIPRTRAIAERTSEIAPVFTSKIRALDTAVRECAEKVGPERLIKYLAPSGGGKSMACNYLAAKRNARIVEVRDIWRHSEKGFVPHVDTCRAIGVRIGKSNNIAKMQDDLVKFSRDRRIILCFDEGEHFGKASLNMLKFLLNKTRIVPVLFAVTSEHEKWFDYFENEANQIARRTHVIIETSDIKDSDASLFFGEKLFADRDTALELIIKEAKRFGHFSMIARVAANLKGINRAQDDDVKKACDSARRQMIREVKEKN